jgi:hypothetical protein
MGEHEEIRKFVVSNLAGNDCPYLDVFMRDLMLDGYLCNYVTGRLKYVQGIALNYNICEFALAKEGKLAETLTSKGGPD